MRRIYDDVRHVPSRYFSCVVWKLNSAERVWACLFLVLGDVGADGVILFGWRYEYMGSIMDYRDLIQLIPVNDQSSVIKKDIWEKFSYKDKFKKAIFGNKDKAELSRADVFSESNVEKKIIMILMWGYPTGGRGNNIKNILGNIKK